jgi:hypothetical protein
MLVGATLSTRQAVSGEPAMFVPAPDAVSMEPAHDALRLSPILPQSFLELADAPLDLPPTNRDFSTYNLG